MSALVAQVRSKITVSRKHATRDVEADTMDEVVVPCWHLGDSPCCALQVSVAEARASEIASKLRQKAVCHIYAFLSDWHAEQVQASWNTSQASPSTGGCHSEMVLTDNW